ncbi:MAG: hypothetical protein V7K97_30375 [Nostoc sp.]|uniref:hypothetical protein n=1 Tax=Nostoc sp. TaxID=1180 RepID=UPI002FFCD117
MGIIFLLFTSYLPQTLNPDQLKEIFKSAIIELIRDNRKEVSEFLAEIIEDVAMEQAIAEGETTELVSRESIFQLLELI